MKVPGATARDFADLLRHLRIEAGHSQEALAELVGVSVDAISAYERRLRAKPRRETVNRLAVALHLTGDARTEFEAAAQPKGLSKTHHPNNPAHNLPWQPTSFVGRNREIEEITNVLTPRSLVTISGTGGIGKTRIALEIAVRRTQSPPDGIWFVDLAPVTNGAFAARTIASVLPFHSPDQDDILEALIGAIKTRELVLILDNCEHILTQVGEIAAKILQTCPKITLLATSRERLGIAGERAYRLATLPVPNATVASAAEACSYDALKLFIERAQAADNNFSLAEEYASDAAAICRRLDGNALAIELAAARIPLLGLRELRIQLSKHFRVVSGGPHDVAPRHRTLHAAISWSYDLLGERERMLFRRLAVFARGWSLDAAEQTCSDDSLEPSSVLELLFALVDKSLVTVDLDEATPRYSFFESVRAFALEELVSAGEEPALLKRHAEWVAAFGDRNYEAFILTPRQRWEQTVAPELDNVLVALDWAIGPGDDIVLAGRIAGTFAGFWLMAGLAAPGRRYLNATLGRIDDGEHPELVARLLNSQFQFLHGASAVDAMKRAISLVSEANGRRSLATSYTMLAHALAQTGRYADAEAAFTKASAFIHEENLHQSSLYAGCLGDISTVFRIQGRLDKARATLAEALSLAASLSDDWSISLFKHILADIEFATGDVQSAVRLGEEALASARSVRGASQELYSLCNLACYQLALGAVDQAHINALEALDLARSSKAYDIVAHVAIQHLAAIKTLKGQPNHGARLLGYVNAWYERMRCPRDPTEQKGYDILIEALHRTLTKDDIAALAAQGAAFTEEAAITEALST